MKEDFLHHVWKFQKFDARGLRTTHAEKVEILDPGRHNTNAGPDFFNAKIAIDGQLWVGNVEIHLRSTDWYLHSHEQDSSYDNVVLHVVWEHDVSIYRADNSEIPTIEVKELVDKQTLQAYRRLFLKRAIWIQCESDFASIDSFVLDNWLERLFLERLERKATRIIEELNSTKNHWEALLFKMLSKNFGLNLNGESFYTLAQSISFELVRKCSANAQELEALLFGQAGMLDQEQDDLYPIELQSNYAYLKYKFDLNSKGVIAPTFFRVRPPNFPSIRLSQLAILYNSKPNLFSEIIAACKLDEYYGIFDIAASMYWDSHYNFGVNSKNYKKKLSKKFVDLLLMNTIIPLKYCYAKYLGKEISEEIIQLASSIPSEKNTIVDRFNELKNISVNAYESQSLLELKNNYCNSKRCLDCAIGSSILKRGSTF